MYQNLFLKQHKSAIIALCEKYEVERLYFFGSILTEDFDENSDVDLQVIFPDAHKNDNESVCKRGAAKMDIWDDFEQLFGRRVDMLTEKPLKNPYFRLSVETSRKLFYERKSEKVFV
jgi:uncharacterized protein